MAQVAAADAFAQFGGIGQVAVVRQHDAERRADVKRLRFGAAAGIAGGGIAHVGDAGVAGEIAHVAGAEYVAHHADVFVHVERIVFDGNDAGGVLAAVLQHLQAVVQQLVDRFVCH